MVITDARFRPKEFSNLEKIGFSKVVKSISIHNSLTACILTRVHRSPPPHGFRFECMKLSLNRFSNLVGLINY
ncbi:MAG: hypothetical protein M3Q77_00405 [Thermoproteota archaeon]|nr:hypothetical protein [Thermoproteota archaeon]